MSTLIYGAVGQSVILTGTADSGSMADNLKTAGLNTLVGLTVVFAVLTIIIFFISLFKIIPYLENKSKEKENSVDNVLARIVEQEEEELVEDHELVAVITAAIYASMGDTVPADGLIVRSIKKVTGRRWMSA